MANHCSRNYFISFETQNISMRLLHSSQKMEEFAMTLRLIIIFLIKPFIIQCRLVKDKINIRMSFRPIGEILLVGI